MKILFSPKKRSMIWSPTTPSKLIFHYFFFRLQVKHAAEILCCLECSSSGQMCSWLPQFSEVSTWMPPSSATSLPSPFKPLCIPLSYCTSPPWHWSSPVHCLFTYLFTICLLPTSIWTPCGRDFVYFVYCCITSAPQEYLLSMYWLTNGTW